MTTLMKKVYFHVPNKGFSPYKLTSQHILIAVMASNIVCCITMSVGVGCRGKYFQGRKVFGDWDVRVEQVCLSHIHAIEHVDDEENLFQK